MMICSPSSIALARTTSSSAVSSATLPISLRYIRTGSSIPIMSADERPRAPRRVGSSTSAGVSFAGASRPGGTLVTPSTASSLDDLDRRARRPRRAPRPRPRRRSMSSSSSSSSTSASGRRGGDAVARRRGRIEASFASSSSRRVRRGRDESTASTSCLSRGSAMVRGSSGDAGREVRGRWWVERSVRRHRAARARSRVWSRRRSSDRRCSLRSRRSSDQAVDRSRDRRRAPPRRCASRLKAAALLPFGVLELEDEPLDLVRERAVAEVARVRARVARRAPGRAPGSPRRGRRGSPTATYGGRTPWSSRARAMTTARYSSRATWRRQAVRAEAVEDRVVRLGHEQHEAQQLLLGPRVTPRRMSLTGSASAARTTACGA